MGNATKYLASISQNCQGQGDEKQGETDALTGRQEDTKETWRLKATWWSRLDPGLGKEL